MSAEQDQYWMQYALQLAEKAEQSGEIPVGAVLVKDGEIVGEGWNQSIQLHDPSAHAEMQAIRQAAGQIENYRLLDCTLYVTLEPCAMCAGAISFARIRRLYYGAADPKGGAVESGVRFFAQPTCHHVPEVYGAVGETEAARLLREFFRERR